MSFIPYSCQSIDSADESAVLAVLRSEFLTQGPAVPAFEAEFARRHQVAHAVAVSSATAGLHIACLALGVGAGSRVWTTPNSFVASANCALYCGASVDFVDIDSRTRNLSVDELARKLKIAAADQTLPDVVIPVDFAGLPCDLAEIRALADQYGFKILEDASHAVGASYRGMPIGSHFADATVFSFHPVKVITTCEGGLVATQDPVVARRLQLLRSHGITRDPTAMVDEPDGPWYYEQVELGFNYRMTDLHAALGTAQLSRLSELHARRMALAVNYDELLRDLPVIAPARAPDRVSAWHLYVIEIDSHRTGKTRREVFDALRAAGIGANVHYIPIHLQPYYRALGFNLGQFPVAERYYERALTIPLYPALSEAQQQRVVATLRDALRD